MACRGAAFGYDVLLIHSVLPDAAPLPNAPPEPIMRDTE